MEGAETIRTAIERNAKTFTLTPSAGQGTAVTRIRLRPGLACEVEEGPWRLTVGMTEKYGGNNAGPNPGIYGRAALGSCLAIGYGIWAARLGVPIAALEVEVQADYDARGELAVADEVPPGYLAMRYIVTVESPAPEADVVRVLDTADRYSSWRDDLARAMPLRREVRLAPRSASLAAEPLRTPPLSPTPCP
jgi:uncharacterized OsmC-like protein